MVRVLIVAKTQMGNGAACVGGLILDTNKSIRLLRPGHPFQPGDTSFDIGHICDLTFHQPSEVIPPHVEDVIVTDARYRGQQSYLQDFLMQRVQPWQGGPDQLFDGLLTIEKTTAYICRTRGIPNCSTGFWLPDKPLHLTYWSNRPYYQIEHVKGMLSIK